MFCRLSAHFQCLFIEITKQQNKQSHFNENLTRYTTQNAKKGTRVSNFTTSILLFISWDIRPMGFEWAIHSQAYNIMLPCLVGQSMCAWRILTSTRRTVDHRI